MTIKYKCLYEITGRIEDVNTFLVPLQDLPKEQATQHWSDCAVHNEPAYPKGECDCGGYKPEQKPVAVIHRNEYNEYRLEPHDSFDITSIPFNIDVQLFKAAT